MERMLPEQSQVLCWGILMVTMRKLRRFIRSPFCLLMIIMGLMFFSAYLSTNANMYDGRVRKMAASYNNVAREDVQEVGKWIQPDGSLLKTGDKPLRTHTDQRAIALKGAHQSHYPLKNSKNPFRNYSDQKIISRFGKLKSKSLEVDDGDKANSLKTPHQSVSKFDTAAHKRVKIHTNDEAISLESAKKSVSQFAKDAKKPLKIYMYNMSSEFTTFITDCAASESTQYITHCLDYSNHGMGQLLYRNGQASIHNTNHFSLDVILHNQFAHSQYRTNDPSEADVFYVPAYMGTLCFCPEYIPEKNSRLFEYLNTMPYFAEGKPHVTTLSKIELEQTKVVLGHPGWKNLTYITIEKALNVFRLMMPLKYQRAIVAPYPSYIHFNYSVPVKTYIDEVRNHKRSIFLLFAGSMRVSNPFRAKIIAQFVNRTSLSFKNFTNGSRSDQVMLVTKECFGNHNNITVEWMLNSVFCLQPHGDSPTRKSFYDSILSGCIPVVFKFPNEIVEFPFQRTLNYSDFIVRIPVNGKGDLEGGITVYDYLRIIPQTEIDRLQVNLLKVLHHFQYPVINTKQIEHPKDALDMIVDEIRAMFNI